MLAQFIFFALFMLTFLAGVFDYFSPQKHPLPPLRAMVSSSDDEAPRETSTNEVQQLNVRTMRGITRIHQQLDDMTQQQKQLTALINDDQRILGTTDKEIAGILNQINGLSGPDVLRLKAVVQQLQDNQRLLVDRGASLIAFNNQLTKNRQWLARQSDLLKLNNEESMRLMQEHDGGLDDPQTLFEKIKQENDDIMERTQDLIDKERQKAQDFKDR